MVSLRYILHTWSVITREHSRTIELKCQVSHTRSSSSFAFARSVVVSLAMVGQLASAYYYQLEIGGMGPSVVSLCLTPVDFQNIAQSQTQRQCAQLLLADVAG